MTEDQCLAAFEYIFDSSRLAMVLVDDDGRYTRVNDAALRLLGYTRDEMLDGSFLDLARSSERPAVRERFETMLRDGGQLTGRRTYVTRSGAEITLQFSATADILPGQHLAVYLTPLQERSAPGAEVSAQQPTTRELEVVRGLALGMTGEEIGLTLRLSERTVRTHIRNVMSKTGAQTRANLVAIALRDGLITV